MLTQNMDYLQPPVDYTREFEELAANPAVQRMMKYAFFGSQQAVEEQTKQFIQETAVDEVIVSSHIFEHQDRLKSYELFAQVMQQINEEVLV